MSKRIPCEDDLKSNDLTAFGLAASRCQHAGGYCMQDGYCHYGNCFENKVWTHEEAAAHIEYLEKQLDESNARFNQIQASHLQLKSMLESAMKRAIHKSSGMNEFVFAYKQCLTILERTK